MRRILRKIAAGVKDKEELGDVSTLADSTVFAHKNIIKDTNHNISFRIGG